MSRTLRKQIGLSQADTARLEELMNAYIEYALIDVEAADLAALEGVEMDAKDRHVLAAAISTGADILLTDNTPHFPAGRMADHGIELIDSQGLLKRLADLPRHTARSPSADRSPVTEVRSRRPGRPGIHRRYDRRRNHQRPCGRRGLTVPRESVGGVL